MIRFRVSDFVGRGGGGVGNRKSDISADFLSSVFDGRGGGVGVDGVGDFGMMYTGFSGNKTASNLTETGLGTGDLTLASLTSTTFGKTFLNLTTFSIEGGPGGGGGGGD